MDLPRAALPVLVVAAAVRNDLMGKKGMPWVDGRGTLRKMASGISFVFASWALATAATLCWSFSWPNLPRVSASRASVACSISTTRALEGRPSTHTKGRSKNCSRASPAHCSAVHKEQTSKWARVSVASDREATCCSGVNLGKAFAVFSLASSSSLAGFAYKKCLISGVTSMSAGLSSMALKYRRRLLAITPAILSMSNTPPPPEPAVCAKSPPPSPHSSFFSFSSCSPSSASFSPSPVRRAVLSVCRKSGSTSPSLADSTPSNQSWRYPHLNTSVAWKQSLTNAELGDSTNARCTGLAALSFK
mmetsp:Transcript_26046/g.52303  ORF Transcript_26046/g.52303 Transcript_26046/m.52303 type:complete len:304 (+) Transcript_26046:1033-1944(+)